MRNQDVNQGGDRYVMALYYAYGRADADNKAIGHIQVKPLAFAEFYDAQWADYLRGQCSHMPSVQDAWDQFRRMVKS
jgi:hypothetical protein